MTPDKRLDDNDLQVFQDALADLYSDLGKISIGDRMLSFLEKVVGSKHIFFDHYAADGRDIGKRWTNSRIKPSVKELATYEMYASDNPVFEKVTKKRTANPVILSDLTTHEDFQRTDIYKGYFSKFGFEHQMGVALRVSSDLLVTCFLMRRDEEFNERDRKMLAIAVPHLINAYRNSADFDKLATALAKSNTGVASVDSKGNIKFASEIARLTLQKLHSGEIKKVPDEMLRQLVETGRSSDEINFKTRSGEVSIKLLSQKDALEKALLFQKRRSLTPATLESLDLTPREAEILYWISQGKSDSDIATLCEISSNTASKHAQNIYKKLGVETRTAAMLRALEFLQK